MALKQYFNNVLVPLKFIPKRTASFWQTIKIPNRFVLKICTGGFADYRYRRNDIFCGSDIFVEGEPRSYDCGTAVFCGGQRKEAVAVWRVEHVVLYLGILDYPLLFCGAQSSGMGHKELASHSFL